MKSILWALLLALVPACAFGQQPAAGDTVRVTAEKRFEAQWLRLDSDSAHIMLQGVERAFALREITRLEVRERKPAAVRGLIFGALAGGILYTAFGAMIYGAVDDLCDEAFGSCTGDDPMWTTALIGTAGGGAIGLLVGSFLTVNSWRDIKLAR